MSTAFEKFIELETRIGRTIELVKTTRQEKDGLEKELAGARSHILRLERELEDLRRERDLVKNKVEALLETLTELTDETGIESEVAAIDVEIYDQKYSIVLQKPLDEAEVRSLADEVDARMREIARVASTADSLKVAVLTALHLAQEYHALKKSCEQNDALIRSKAAEWTRALEQVLKK